MKKVYFYAILILLIIISSLNVSAKEIKTCIRTENNLHVLDKFILEENKDDILSTPCVDDMDKVYDFANLLTDVQEDFLYNQILDYIKISNYDLALVTINYNPKIDTKHYADDFYDYNSFGKNQTRDGVLILLDMDNQEIYISTTGYAIKMYDDYRIEKLLDSGYNELTNQQYYECFKNIVENLKYYFNLEYPESNNEMLIDENGDPYFLKYISYPLVFIMSGLITLIISLILYFKSRLKIKLASVTSYLKTDELTLIQDDYINGVVTHTRINTNSSNSLSKKGGSSFHSSSSGSRHGGGGRKF